MKKFFRVPLIVISLILLLILGNESINQFMMKNSLTNHYGESVKVENCKSVMKDEWQRTCLININDQYKIVMISKSEVLLEEDITKDEYFNALSNK